MAKKLNHWKSVWGNKQRKTYLIVCVAVALAIAFVQPAITNRFYAENELLDLLSSIRDASLYFAAAVSTASATILALMLTLLSMTHQASIEFDRSTYRGIQLIGFVSTVTFIISIILLLCLSFPIGEFSSIPNHWYRILYYIITALNGAMSGLMIYGVLILFEIIRGIIHKIAPDKR